jgi:hypothetical protein
MLSAAKMLLCNLGKKEYDLNPNLYSLKYIEGVQQENTQELVCRGNTLADAWRYLYVVGTPTEMCFPYELNSHVSGPTLAEISQFEQTVPLCTQYAGKYGELCIDGSPQRVYRAIQYYRVLGVIKDGGSEENLRRELYTYGPFSTGMRVYADFYQFDPKRQVYQSNEAGGQISGHAIRMVGWGQNAADGKYWWVANTFGTNWGIDGYFKMRRGTNNCGIEENVIVGLPDMFFGTLQSMAAFKVSVTDKDLIQEDYRFRTLYENINSSGGGIDPKTGYMRYYYKLWPELKDSGGQIELWGQAPVAGEITWSNARKGVFDITEHHELRPGCDAGSCNIRMVQLCILVGCVLVMAFLLFFIIIRFQKNHH